tara:strand:- start:814 stop:1944 length:1131 start_codon:yes stop_codon:yes gene_type:complete
MTNEHILLVEDNDFQRQVLKQMLLYAGYHHVNVVNDGLEALAYMERAVPDLVITDLEMPGMRGIELCRRMKASTRLKSIPILVQTAMNDEETKNNIFNEGIDDFMPKPLNTAEFIARIQLHLERAALTKRLSEFHQRLNHELHTAAETLKTIFPTSQKLRDIQTDYGVEITAYSKASSELGGDYWGVEALDASRYLIYIVDFSGHGVAAALNTFRLHMLMSRNLHQFVDAGSYLTLLNHVLEAQLPDDQFATMFLGIVDTSRAELTYASAGAPSPLLLGPEDRIAFLPSDGIPLGAFPHSQYETRQCDFPKGSDLFLYSDALYESQDKQGRILDMLSVVDMLHEIRSLEILQTYVQTQYHENWPDDLTMLYAKYLS